LNWNTGSFQARSEICFGHSHCPARPLAESPGPGENAVICPPPEIAAISGYADSFLNQP